MENINIKENKRSKKLEININNYFSVENIDELKSNVLDALGTSKHISLKLESIESIDIGGIQFIYSLQKEAKQREIDFELLFEGNEDITTLLKKTGFENLLLTNIK